MLRSRKTATSKYRRFWKTKAGGLNVRLYEKPAHVLHDMLVNKEITSVELTEDVLARIDEVEGDVKAYLRNLKMKNF